MSAAKKRVLIPKDPTYRTAADDERASGLVSRWIADNGDEVRAALLCIERRAQAAKPIPWGHGEAIKHAMRQLIEVSQL